MGKEYVKCWTSPKGKAVIRSTSKRKLPTNLLNSSSHCSQNTGFMSSPPRSWFASFLPSLEPTGWGMMACIVWNPCTDWTYIFDYWSSSCPLVHKISCTLSTISSLFFSPSLRSVRIPPLPPWKKEVPLPSHCFEPRGHVRNWRKWLQA